MTKRVTERNVQFLGFFLLPLTALLFFILGFSIKSSVPSDNSYQKNTSDTVISFDTNKTRFTVTDVLDGDTIVIDTGEHVRYKGIDAPEKLTYWGARAHEYNDTLVNGKTVDLKYDGELTDQYGRILAYVYIDGKMVNELLVKEGYATVETFGKKSDPKYYDTLLKVQQQAKNGYHGLWFEDWINKHE